LLLGPRSERPLLARREDFEPLYLELLGRLRAMSPAAADPPSLVEVIEAHLQSMPGHVRLVLAAIAAAGIVGLGDLACLDLPAGAPARAFNTLARERYIDIEGGQARLIHPLFGEVAVGSVPASAVAEVHAHMESGLANRTDCEELRAYHALRGHPDLAAYLLMEGVARQRDARGDYGGAIVALRDAVVVAQSQYTRGDPDALSVWASFGRKLASALTRVGRTDDAHGVLTEILHVLDPRDPARPLLLEQLTDVAERRGRAPDAARYRAEAGALRSARIAPR
jgi:hypothetical protein